MVKFQLSLKVIDGLLPHKNVLGRATFRDANQPGQGVDGHPFISPRQSPELWGSQHEGKT
ncbi:hypothetical protein N7530_004336 [Penicillium desertorum]|uniref:Uncharacterized protein n=1 Tax=Penicillium desertorum TaxID=1303715 RepID=A0A9W9WYC0_9EURO|nr:hypothetical protein N7530_004336 [Penicillium desertorum]